MSKQTKNLSAHNLSTILKYNNKSHPRWRTNKKFFYALFTRNFFSQIYSASSQNKIKNWSSTKFPISFLYPQQFLPQIFNVIRFWALHCSVKKTWFPKAVRRNADFAFSEISWIFTIRKNNFRKLKHFRTSSTKNSYAKLKKCFKIFSEYFLQQIFWVTPIFFFN